MQMYREIETVNTKAVLKKLQLMGFGIYPQVSALPCTAPAALVKAASPRSHITSNARRMVLHRRWRKTRTLLHR